MRLPTLWAALVAVGCGPGSHPRAAAAGDSAPAGRALARVVTVLEEAVERGEIPGAVVLAGRGGRPLLRAAVGRRALVPGAEPMTADTLFDLASLTKPVATACAVMKLVQEGRVRLQAPVAEYLPAFGERGKQGITVEHLLLHQGGLVPDNPLADYADGPQRAWERICALEPVAAPGTRFAYSDVGFIVLGELVRAVDGRPLDVFCRQELFEPLGLESTTFRPAPELSPRCAPTERRQGHWMRGEVHDPRAYALGGVAGHAGLFSTADDLARWCRMILGDGELDGVRVLAAASVAEMTRPRWLADGSGGRALGLDVDTAYSSARGEVFPRGASYGHTGFTGTSLWLDPQTQTYVILLTNRVHPDGSGKVLSLRRAVATAVGRAVLGEPQTSGVRTGVDVLEEEHFARLVGAHVGLITNVTGRSRTGQRTIDLMARAGGVELVRILTPEHGALADREGDVEDGVDVATGVPILSLYGDTRRPTAGMLAGIDTLVFDLQDVGTRFYTYATTMGYAMEAAAEHGLRFVVLDRPNPIGGTRLAGPCADPARLSFIAYRPIPVVHGLTIGELARLFVSHFGVGCELQVVACQGWRRDMAWEETGLVWIDPSPNLRNPTQALLYPAIGLLEGANLSVGRGTDEPFERLGAPWIDGRRLARALNGARLAGLRFTPIEFTPEASAFAGQPCGGVHVTLTDPGALAPVQAGLTIAWHLNRLFGSRFDAAKVDGHLVHRATWEALMTCADPRELPAGWSAELEAFRAVRERVLLYE